MAQLALAWVISNPKISSVLTGVTSLEQLTENIKAIEIAKKISRRQLDMISKLESRFVLSSFLKHPKFMMKFVSDLNVKDYRGGL